VCHAQATTSTLPLSKEEALRILQSEAYKGYAISAEVVLLLSAYAKTKRRIWAMATKRKSGGLLKSSKKASKTTPLGESIVRGLEEGLAHMRGEIRLRTRTFYVPEDVDVRALREKAGLSQSQFAQRYGFNPRTIQDWEQGRARPDSAVRAYLTVIARNPEAVRKALS
jgi:putative transcriptional regulator